MVEKESDHMAELYGQEASRIISNLFTNASGLDTETDSLGSVIRGDEAIYSSPARYLSIF